MSECFFERHQEKIESAINAIQDRGYYSAYPEVPSGKIYGEHAKSEGKAFFDSVIGSEFWLNQSTIGSWIGDETSPYGIELGVSYPDVNVDELLTAMTSACDGWKKASVETRVGCALEILDRLNKKSFDMAFAVMHTTGQGFMMAFQAGGPHAQDRGLEAVAYAYKAMLDCPTEATWKKQVGKDEFVTLDKQFKIVPRGIGLVIACSTFPTWNSYPGLFASLVTGNGVIVKPHPQAILPSAMTIRVCQEVLMEAGFDANVVTLVADTIDAPKTAELVQHDSVSIVDYTGGSAFGEWVESNAGDAIVYTEKSGINSIIIDSVESIKLVSGNIGFSLCLYSGQMCTTPQNIFIPKEGISTADGTMSFDDVAQAILKAVDWMLSDQGRANEVLGAVQNQATADRVDGVQGDVLRSGDGIEHAMFPEARTRTIKIVKTTSSDLETISKEHFGPVVFIVETESTEESIQLASSIARDHGAISCGLYSTSDDVIEHAIDSMTCAGVPVSCNLVGNIWVNQSAAFSDFHVSGANPSGNATLTDSAFIAGRFNVVQCRTCVPTPQKVEA